MTAGSTADRIPKATPLQIWFLAMAVTGVAIGFAFPSFAAAADPGVYNYEGQVAGCDYTVQIDSNAKEIDLATDHCQPGGLVSTSQAGYSGKTITPSGDVTASGAIGGSPVSLDQSLDPGSFEAGSDIDALVTSIVGGANPDVLQPVADRFAVAMTARIAAAAMSQAFGGAMSDNGIIGQVRDAESNFCDGYSDKDVSHTNSNCYPLDCTDGCDAVLPRTADVGVSAGEDRSATFARESSVKTDSAAGSLDSDSASSLCPGLNDEQSRYVFACEMTTVHGDVDTGASPWFCFREPRWSSCRSAGRI